MPIEDKVEEILNDAQAMLRNSSLAEDSINRLIEKSNEINCEMYIKYMKPEFARQRVAIRKHLKQKLTSLLKIKDTITVEEANEILKRYGIGDYPVKIEFVCVKCGDKTSKSSSTIEYGPIGSIHQPYFTCHECEEADAHYKTTRISIYDQDIVF
ncbi:MAG: hypothetical protein OXC46_08030 [Thaumarchaeota archaeon]|nr:hypothetical protein [Nitrososphaerota archaeon]